MKQELMVTDTRFDPKTVEEIDQRLLEIICHPDEGPWLLSGEFLDTEHAFFKLLERRRDKLRKAWYAKSNGTCRLVDLRCVST